MSKKAFVFAFLGVLISVLVVHAGTIEKKDRLDISRLRLINSQLVAPQSLDKLNNPNLITQSPGFQVGTSYCDYQTNGSSGNRITVTPLGEVLFDWMNGVDDNTAAGRYIYAGQQNLVNPADSLTARETYLGWPGGGYCQIAYLNVAGNNKAIAAYHRTLATSHQWYTLIAKDTSAASSGPNRGKFMEIDVPNDQTTAPAYRMIWPYITVDRNQRIHLTATESQPTTTTLQWLGYWRSTDAGATWTTPIIIDTVTTISAIITSSPVSDKVAIVYNSPKLQWYIGGDPLKPTYFDNDVAYVESPDGVTWNPATQRVNVTNYGPLPTVDSDTALRAYTDLDAIYDFNDNLHIIWTTPHISFDGTTGDTVILYYTTLWHWSAATGITELFDHPTRNWRCDMGAWNMPICKMSLSVDSASNLFATFTAFNSNDAYAFDSDNPRPDYCGNNQACCNGDLYISWSTNGGNIWSAPKNMTFSFSPGCTTGVCESDNWSSAAEFAGRDSISILYINDKDAGGAIQTEGQMTLNPVVYLKYPNPVAHPPTYASVFPYSGGYVNDTVSIANTGRVDTFQILMYNFGDATLHSGIHDIASWLSTADTLGNYIDTLIIPPFDDMILYIIINTTGLTLPSYAANLNFNTNDPESPNITIACSLQVIGGAPQCNYLIGDISGDGQRLGGDVTYGVRYFKGIGTAPKDSCFMDSTGTYLYVAGDCNGNCEFRGSDITRLVAYFKGNAQLTCCHFFPTTLPPYRPRHINVWRDQPNVPNILPSVTIKSSPPKFVD